MDKNNSYVGVERTSAQKIDDILKKGRPQLPPAKLEGPKGTEKVETSTNVKSLAKGSPIEISPPEVIITDIDVNQTYEVLVLIRNLTSQGRRIRIYQPKTSKFRCDYDMAGNIASGLALKLLVSFESNTVGDYHDFVEIVSDHDFKAILPLHAYAPQAQISFEPFINFGFIRTSQEKVEKLVFKNEGKRDGVVNLRFEKTTEMKIEPHNFTVKAGDYKEVTLKYKPKDAGIFRGIIEVAVEGQSIMKHIDVSATSVDYFITVIDENGAVQDNFDFGNIYFGEKREVHGYLVNNSPQKYVFRSKFLTGLQNNMDEASNTLTPNEVGKEQTDRIMQCYPSEGVIESYSQVPIRFTCKSKINDNIIFWTRNYCMAKLGAHEFDTNQNKMPTRDYQYTCVFEFNGKSELTPFIHLQAKGVCPTVKISHHLIEFGECKVNENRDFQVVLENYNQYYPVDYNFTKVAQFDVTPRKDTLIPNVPQSLIFTFKPKNLGTFNIYTDLELFGIYKIPIRLTATANENSGNKSPLRGLEMLPESFSPERKYVNEELIHFKNKMRKSIIKSSEHNKHELTKDQLNQLRTSDYNTFKKENLARATEFVKDSRTKRAEETKLKKSKLDNGLVEEQVLAGKAIGGGSHGHDSDEERENILLVPKNNSYGVDFLDAPKLGLPDMKDTLFVTRPLGRYEPYSVEVMDQWKPNPDRSYKKMFPGEPLSQAEIRDIAVELSPEKLQKIFAGPAQIDFGHIYIKSKMSKWFAIKNELRASIKVQLIFEHEEIRNSYSKPQIIPGGHSTGFEIVFCSNVLQNFKGLVTYRINDRHDFKFIVEAIVEPVRLELETTSTKLYFSDSSLELTTKENIKIFNRGNAAAKYTWECPTGIFTVKPEKGEVPPYSHSTVEITYKPSGKNFKGEIDTLTMRVDEGDDQRLFVTGYVSESRCAFKPAILDFGDIPVGDQRIKYVHLQNKHRNSLVFQINDNISPYLKVEPLNKIVPADSYQDIKVTFLANEEVNLDVELIANIRGGQQQKLQIVARTVVPNIKIEENDFDFEGVTLGNKASKKMTIVNESNIAVTLVVDLRNPENKREFRGVECLELCKDPEYDDEESAMQSIAELDDSLGDNSQNSDTEEEIVEKAQSKRFFTIGLKAKQRLHFQLTFSPTRIEDYRLVLPITLQSYGNMEGLTRIVTCHCIQPRLVILPTIVVFNKKVISGAFEKPVPIQQECTFKNLDHYRSLSWRLDCKSINDERIFFAYNTEGVIGPGGEQTLNFGFSPINPGEYAREISVYLDKDTKPYSTIELKGKGAFPRLNFDRRELILPVVPLDIEAKAAFYILNDGYENVTLTHYFSNDVGQLPIKLIFPEGENVGVTRPKLKVEVSFCSKKPMSFTTEVVFKDDRNHIYPLKISGTADNCLLTNYSFIQRNVNDIQISSGDGRPIRISLPDPDEPDENDSRHATSVKTGTSRVNKGLLGYTPIPQSMIDQTCQGIVNWMNYNVVSNLINMFPNDVIEHDGAEIYELLQFLTNKNNFPKSKIDGIKDRKERVRLLYKQYDDLLRTLKENGALLNTIRPEYLMKYPEFMLHIKSVNYEYLSPGHAKIPESKFQYISCDAWITLFYQIIKIYYLGRINLKTFKNVPGIPYEKQTIPDYYIEGSNLCNLSENLLFRWLEIQFENMRPNQTRRITNLERDLRDGLFFATSMQSYIDPNCSKSLAYMRQQCGAEEDFVNNSKKVIEAMNEVGLQTYFTHQDLVAGKPREMILLSLYLFNNLPHYIPKTTIEFSCQVKETVVKTIEINNPNNKPINYRVKLESPTNDFSIEGEEKETTIEIGPKERYPFPIRYTARLSSEVTGRIMFTNKRESNVQAAAIVFKLKSVSTGIKSEDEVFSFEGKMYDLKTKEIVIKNPFPSDGLFKIEIYAAKPSEAELAAAKKNMRYANPRKTETKPPEYATPPFFCKADRVHIRAGKTLNLIIQYMPMERKRYHYCILFRDEKIGEMQYDLVGEVTDPVVMPDTQSPMQTYLVDGEQTYTFAIPPNSLMTKARNIHIDRLPPVERARERDRDAAMKKEKMPDTLVFEVESRSQYLQVPRTITIYTSPKYQKDNVLDKSITKDAKDNKSVKKYKNDSVDSRSDNKMLTPQNPDNVINLTFNIRTPVRDFPMRFLIKNDQYNDYRLFEIRVNVQPRPLSATLELKCPARDSIEQPIPIYNTTNNAPVAKIALQVVSGPTGYITVPKEVVMKPKGPSNVSLTFKPLWMCTVEAKLSISNPVTNEVYNYDIKAIGEEPLAEPHYILECRARKSTIGQVLVRNYTDPQRTVTYTVETDLINARGPSTITVGSKPEYYKFEVTPVLGGVYTGSITFKDDEGKYLWYTVEIRTEPPKPEKTVELTTTIRKAVAFDVALANPLDEPVEFDIHIQGNGLVGQDKFVMLPNQSSTYELLFSPLTPGRERGLITFTNEKLGEITYELVLIAELPSNTRLDLVEAELGKSKVIPIILDNPSGEDVPVSYKLSNPYSFDVMPSDIVLPKFSKTPISIIYSPSQLGNIESSDITFETQKIGNWLFSAYGKGVPPQKYETTVFSGTLGRDSTHTINFKNPFKEAIIVNVSIEGDKDHQQAFELLLKNKRITVGGLNILQLPITFLPNAIAEFNIDLVLSLNDKIQWRYPIIGITESTSITSDFSIKTKCRTKYETQLKMTLPGLTKVDPHEKFIFDLVDIPKEIEVVLAKWLTLLPVKQTLNDPRESLVLGIRLAPLKPLKANMKLLVSKPKGGRWVFNLALEVAPPDPDHTIHITAHINTSSTVSFKLANIYRYPAEFWAAFTSDSDPEFTVQPSNGMLEPDGKEGTPFLITFTPVNYGLIRSGKLIIQTEEMYWSYLVKGNFPKYVPPKAKETTLDNRISQDLEEKLHGGNNVSKNFIMRNVKNTKSPDTFRKRKGSRSKSKSRSRSRSNSPKKQAEK